MVRNGKYSPFYLHPHACFQCRKSFKRAYGAGAVAVCPHCGGPSICLNRKFKAPRTSDVKQWNKVEKLVRHGFFFENVGEPYPMEIGEVDKFAEKHSTYLMHRRKRHAATYEAIEAAFNTWANR